MVSGNTLTDLQGSVLEMQSQIKMKLSLSSKSSHHLHRNEHNQNHPQSMQDVAQFGHRSLQHRAGFHENKSILHHLLILYHYQAHHDHSIVLFSFLTINGAEGSDKRKSSRSTWPPWLEKTLGDFLFYKNPNINHHHHNLNCGKSASRSTLPFWFSRKESPQSTAFTSIKTDVNITIIIIHVVNLLSHST